MTDMKHISLCLILELMLLFSFVESGPRCYDCQRIPYPRDCDRIKICGDHERCFVRQYISTSGVFWYDSGCFPVERCVAKRSIGTVRSSKVGNMTALDKQEDSGDIVVCEHCCDGEYCNSAGCKSQPLPPLTARGPVCYSCHQQRADDSCDVVRTCKIGEECYLKYVHGSFDVIYSTGCMPAAQCDSLNSVSLVGKRQSQALCASCCFQDYCNQNCSSLHSHAVNPPYTRSTSSPSLSVATPDLTSLSTTVKPFTTSAVNYCLSSPCKNGGSCIDLVISYYCKCQTGYIGKFCETNIDDCLPNPCLNGGTCIDQVNDFQCICEAGYTGLMCEKDIDECIPNPCQNGGTCTDQVNTYRCTCQTGYTGDRCGSNIDDCSPNPCQNGGTCVDLIDGFQCSCPKEYTGNNCETNLCEAKHYQFVKQFGLCYKLYRNRKTWSSARDSCKREGGDLIVFANQAERDYFDQLARGIYAKTNQYERRFWVGASDLAVEGDWKWLDGTLVNRAYFHPQEPNNAYNGEDCAAMTYFHTDNHTWLNDDGCDVESDYMCQLHVTDKATRNNTCINSDFNYAPAINMCYQIYKDNPKNWTDAQKFCEGKQANLLILNNDVIETHFVNQPFYDTDNNHRYWLGGHDFAQRHKFVWLNGQPLSTSLKWNNGEPNDYHANERCLDFTYAFGNLAINDDNCGKKLYFICAE